MRRHQEKYTQLALVSHSKPAPHHYVTKAPTPLRNPLQVIAPIIFPCILILDQCKTLTLCCSQTKVPFLNLRSDPRTGFLSEVPDQTVSLLIWVLAYLLLPKFLSSCHNACQATLPLRGVSIFICMDCHHPLVMAVVRALSGAKDRAY